MQAPLYHTNPGRVKNFLLGVFPSGNRRRLRHNRYVDKEIVMTVLILDPVVTFDDAGIEVVEFVESWFDSDDLGYAAEYAEGAE